MSNHFKIKQTMEAKENKQNFEFDYEVFDNTKGEAAVHIGTVSVPLTDSEVAMVAESLERNGGLEIDLRDIGWLSDRVWEASVFDFQNHSDKEELDYDVLEVCPVNNLPSELMAAARQGGCVELRVNFYYQEGGGEQIGLCLVRIAQEEFDAMVDVVKRCHTEGTDFDNLKADHPEAYARSGEWVLEYAYKYGISTYGRDIHPYLKEFPFQVYEAVAISC